MDSFRSVIVLFAFNERLTELDEDLPEVIGMPAEVEETLVANGALVVCLPKGELLRIAHRFHGEADGVEDNARNVTTSPERWLLVLLDVGGVKNGDGHRDSPDPDHLEYPEAEKGEELVALVIEAVVLARLQDAEQQEPRQS